MRGDVTITGEDTKLTVTGSECGAGIGAGEGSGWAPNGDLKGTVTIDCGELSDIKITAGDRLSGGAGIGAGYSGNMTGEVYILGGNVTIQGGNGGAGIGGGRESHYCGGEGGTVYIGGGNITINLYTQDSGGPLSNEAIGAGDCDRVSGTCYIASGNNTTGKYMRVNYKNARDSSAKWSTAEAGKRTGKLHATNNVVISECNHKDVNGKSGLTYTIDGSIGHIMKCKYCGLNITTDHVYDANETCECGYKKTENDLRSVRLGSYSGSGDAVTGWSEVQFVAYGYSFEVPECEHVPSDKRFVGWTVLGTDTVYQPYENIEITSDIVLTASYADLYTISRETDDEIEGGSLSLSKYAADYDDEITVNATPDEGYTLKSVTVRENYEFGEIIDSTEVAPGQNSVKFHMPASDVYVSVEFKELTYTADVCYAENGTVTFVGDHSFGYSAVANLPSVTMTVTPNEGYHLEKIYGEYIDENNEVAEITVVQVGDEYVFEMPKANVDIIAEFEQDSVDRCIIKNASITLGGELGLNFYVLLPDEVADAGAVLVMDGPYGEQSVPVSELEADSEGRFKVSYRLKAIHADRKVSFKVTDAEGETLDLYKYSGVQVDGNVLEYGIYDYVEDAKNTPNVPDEYMNVVYSTYTYCAYSVKWKYGTALPEGVNELPNTDLTVFEKYRLKTEGASETVSLAGVSLKLDSNMALKLYFTVSDEIYNHSFMLGAESLEAHETNTEGMYYVEIANIPALLLREDNNVVIDGDYTVAASPMTYIYYFYKNGNGDEDVENVLRAIYAYSLSLVPEEEE